MSDRIYVLHVDDDPAVVEAATGALKQAHCGITVETETNVADGLKRLDEGTFDCVIAGYDLPGQTGVEFLDAVRKQSPDMPFVLFTTEGNEAAASDAISAGVTEYLRADGGAEPYARLAHTVVNAVERTADDIEPTQSTRRERAIEELHSTARAFMRATTADAVAQVTVDAARTILNMPANAVHFADGDGLYPAAWTNQVEELIGMPPVFEPGDGLAWQAFETGETRVHNDVASSPDRYNPDTDIQSELILPLGDHGVLLIGSCEIGAFDDTDVTLARTLSVHATAALNRLDRDRQLREERDFIDQALNTLYDLFYVIGTDGSLQRWNERIPEVTGYSDDEIDEMSVSEFFPADEHETVAAAVEKTRASGRVTVEAEILTADGERIPYEFAGTQLTDADGAPVGTVGIGRDISQRKAYEQQLERQNERLDEFTSIVSHDLRNPLTVAEGNLELARAEYDSDALDKVSRAHERMRALIDDLLAFARAGETATDLESVALTGIVEECWQSVESDQATLVVEGDRQVQADTAKLRRLLANLLRNSVEHGSTGAQAPADNDTDHSDGSATVRVGVIKDTDRNGFYVADDGPGIPEDDREQVFEEGYSTGENGTGFGLKIVQRLAEVHGWTVTATESEAGGARFEVTGLEPA
ncbi:adaptive-response sensory-kinase [Haloarcula marismortui ATCC 43049]|uniref:histidine kinase n=1 Tax=Haloarcula marismortui (strain ATCC 43049 / DSM 3752 / JCM 8966 / VKM B-1809) TaxID=272569 RepID=Q5UZG8_HALMA|nr:ATP-binding protein [Haloarcula marismortui]AAV47335.1 adaptive-response sensory-kinase [Haloarcula marismortui ATCC 43049]QCP92040.1 PAS domain S-box protein [Haloarcula marismortui ATCC 43049]